ncbi:MAG: 23S rRNA (adenine(2503)-C(2))-methyltransferase RlmN [Candidatus Omnitrophica bacterium]|nr:23S rRNA (adenine(2503)-C(2))-methyltransferase RlmN [Candidatus Omnitrophota bacterium]MDE2222172.1 23S rRNA (adenine(2503)-C(2))-methyltransferase RlmN [Candidatus Omnitrophota bacterium]
MTPDIRDLSWEELTAYLKSARIEPFRAQQIWQWIYPKGVWNFDGMGNLPKDLKERLKKDFLLGPFAVDHKVVSEDGTTKFLFDLHDHEKIESVLIPTATRTTACISTQAGCKFGCKFCASGLGGWKRHLSCAEIVTQLLHVKEESLKHPRPLSNIVFMGTGEPLDNFDNLMKAIRIINSDKGFNIGARHITISTVGVVPRIKELAGQGLQVELAVSLHGYDNPSRNVLMPVNRKYPFDELIAACREYVRLTKRQITFEYILIKGVTCTPNAVESLKKAFKGLICKMNLIPYNPVSEFGHQTPTRQEMLAFRDSLEDSGIHATIRTPRGKDVNAACGQLRHQRQNQN